MKRPTPPKQAPVGPTIVPATQSKKTGLSVQIGVNPKDKARYASLH